MGDNYGYVLYMILGVELKTYIFVNDGFVSYDFRSLYVHLYLRLVLFIVLRLYSFRLSGKNAKYSFINSHTSTIAYWPNKFIYHNMYFLLFLYIWYLPYFILSPLFQPMNIYSIHLETPIALNQTHEKTLTCTF